MLLRMSNEQYAELYYPYYMDNDRKLTAGWIHLFYDDVRNGNTFPIPVFVVTGRFPRHKMSDTKLWWYIRF